MRRIFLFISIAIFLLGCSSELNEKNIVGKWRITEFSTNAELSPLLIASAKKIALSTTYEINSNHSFTLQDAYEPEGAQGEWKLNTDRKQIELYFEHNTTGKPFVWPL